MLLAACSRLCNRDSAWAGVFASAEKPFCFIKSFEVRCMLSWQIENTYGTIASPYKIWAIMSKKTVLPASERTVAFVVLKSILIAVIVYLVKYIFIESNDLENSTNNCVVSRYSARIPSMIRCIVKIGEVVDWFFQKHFWYFLEFCRPVKYD